MTAQSGSTTTTATITTASSSSPAMLPTPPSKSDAKPIKLRAACNHCFSAKVRCDGNKQGCRRCSEKKLSCVYSESRVGKVVGKRRKRPIDDSIGNINSQNWIVNGTVPLQSIPSPATTHGSDESTKRHGNTPSWTSFIAAPDQGFLPFDDTADSLNAIDTADNRSFSVTSDLALFNNSGLPTPALSPPQFTRYLSPAQLETRPTSSQASGRIDPSRLHPPTSQVPRTRQVDATPEDEETVCLKLLAHLKKHAADELQPREAQLELLKKCNAAVRRVLCSKTIRSDYACHLLLSNIIHHLVRLCERLCQGKQDEPRNIDSQFLQDQVHFEAVPGFFDTAAPQPLSQTEQESILSLIEEVMASASVVGDMLKRKPLQGFQNLGRHETFHLELEQRLKKARVSLQSWNFNACNGRRSSICCTVE
ncbi:uncharacterized protein Z518_09802 [Rhinocladiella mackenziei CBS 650.93]|uniref:Zn(2)-C6 fungal-type domain-containing protein n=1 Tax=Rhinocladiella mackenziei CBS 650.93 TaxID=1442369 RepID=A0A0D2FFE1_9EURO|nr:uncharacterized protein Z518_09802 [Rhinocladiella mackenziei CBS 650.93]KIX00737.1 hypothetical protein Z518_09802 [Rhinocladiella mackenziei CBS 650.93]